MKKGERGAALLISVLILTAILIGFAVVGSRGFLQETSTLTTLINKKRAEALTAACLEEAFYRLGTNPSYAGNETINLNNSSCLIRPLISGSDTWTIEIEAQAGNETSRIRVTLSSRSPIIISSWQTVLSF